MENQTLVANQRLYENQRLYDSMSQDHFVLYDHHFNKIDFDEKKHKISETTHAKVGDYLYYTRALSGPEDMCVFYKVSKVTPKQVVIETEQNLGEGPFIKEVRLKRYSAKMSSNFYYQSGRYSFWNLLTAEEHRDILTKLAQ